MTLARRLSLFALGGAAVSLLLGVLSRWDGWAWGANSLGINALFLVAAVLPLTLLAVLIGFLTRERSWHGAAPRRLSLLLLLGLLSAPHLCVWFLLRPGYPGRLRLAGFVYTAVQVALAVFRSFVDPAWAY